MFATSVLLGLIGLILGFVGSVVLAFSLSRVIRALSLATVAHDLALEGLFDRDLGAPVVRYSGTDMHVEKGQMMSTIATWAGLGMLALSFAFQADALLMAAI